MKYQQSTIIVKILHAKFKKKNQIFAFQEGMENEGIEILGTRGPFGISAITKSTDGVAFGTP